MFCLVYVSIIRLNVMKIRKIKCFMFVKIRFFVFVIRYYKYVFFLKKKIGNFKNFI